MLAVTVATLISTQFLAAPANAIPTCGFPHSNGEPDDAMYQYCNVPPANGWLPATGCLRTSITGDGITCENVGFTNCPNVNYCYGTYSAAVPELEDYAAAAFLVLALTIGWNVRRLQQMA